MRSRNRRRMCRSGACLDEHSWWNGCEVLLRGNGPRAEMVLQIDADPVTQACRDLFEERSCRRACDEAARIPDSDAAIRAQGDDQAVRHARADARRDSRVADARLVWGFEMSCPVRRPGRVEDNWVHSPTVNVSLGRQGQRVAESRCDGDEP